MNKSKKWYVAYYRIDGKPQGLTRRLFVIESLIGFLIIASTFIFFPFSFGLIALCSGIPFWLFWWGIGRYNVNKLERGENRR